MPHKKFDLQVLSPKHTISTVFCIYVFQLYLSWADDVTLAEVTYPRYGSVHPWPLNTLLSWQKKRSVCKKLSALGWLTKSLDEVYAEVERCCQALSESESLKCPNFVAKLGRRLQTLLIFTTTALKGCKF